MEKNMLPDPITTVQWWSPVQLMPALLGGIIGSVVVAIWTTFRENKKANRDLTLKVWETWMSQRMFDRRRDLMDILEPDGEHPIPPNRYVDYAKLKDKNLESTLHSLQHFFVDLAALKGDGLLDVKLFEALFGETLLRWSQLMPVIRDQPWHGGRDMPKMVKDALRQLALRT